MSEAPEPPGTTLMAKLQAVQFEWVEGSNRWIISTNRLNSLVNLQNVGEELMRISRVPLEKDSLEFYASEICRARKRLFAILLCGWGARSKCCKTILELVKEGVTDADLPFERVHLTESESSRRDARRSYKLCVKGGHAKCTSSNHRCVVRALQDWPQPEIDNFSRDQWMVLSPVFDKVAGQIRHYDFDDRILLPFKEDYRGTQLLQGGYSEVWPVRICAGHQMIYQSPNPQENEPMLAVKRLFSSHESDFENETGMLIPLTNEKHNHLVELLATYKYKGKYHFLFPYANANLRSLWAQKPKPRRSTTNYEWALDQMTGLASGLVVVHQYKLNMAYNPAMGHAGITRFRQSARRNLVVDPAEEKYGRHGDLKPENILLVKELKGDDLSGILQIADFGLGRFHRFESKSRVDPKTIVGSATYMPPELSLEKQVSRAYDIWSLGCVYLEFATWLLEGSAGLDEFTDKRAEAGLDAVTDDTFYSLVDGGAVVRRSVHHWIEHLCNSPRCSNMVYDLLKLLQNRLVVVDPASRINAEDLYKELKKMIQKSKDSNQYLVGRDG